MRVLYWTELFWPYVGGVEVLSVQLLPALRACGHEITVVTSHGATALPDEDEHAGIGIHRFAFNAALARRDLQVVAALRHAVVRLEQRLRPEIIHLNTSQPSLLFHLLARTAYACPSVHTLHEPLPQPFVLGSLIGRALLAADRIVAVSASLQADLLRAAPQLDGRTMYIPNGLAAPGLDPAPPAFDLPRLLCLGRLVPEKGFDVALRAFAIIRARHAAARLTIAGDGPAREPLRRLCADHDLSAAVDFPGWVAPEDVPALMAAADLILVPSRWREPFGLVALQAAQMGRPVIASRTGGLSEVVADGETGVLTAPDDAGALVRAVLQLLDQPATAQRMGAAARQRAREQFSLERVAGGYDQLYRELARSSGSVP